ncbi:outer membrane lipoprotein LolB [Comamonas sp. 4034]|uniref:outer membrane lipoprotein LolB n=1 Tax=Comamonas sp. 4034 TaxID=3156455 RepID=UPI003D203799
MTPVTGLSKPIARRRFCATLATGTALALLAGCATPQRQLTPAAGAGYWSGRMSVQVQTAPPQTTSGSFELSGSPRQGELVLLNPLGNIVARVHWTAEQASVTQGNTVREKASLDELTEELLGANLPIAALFDWLQGRNTPAAGWQADLDAFSDGKITAQRTSPLPEASLRIVLERP